MTPLENDAKNFNEPATKDDLAELDGKIDALGAELKTELKWLKIIGGTIIGLLILPWLASFLGANLPGP